MFTPHQKNNLLATHDSILPSLNKTYSYIECSHGSETVSLGKGTLTIAETSLTWEPNESTQTESSINENQNKIVLPYTEFCIHGIQTEGEGKRSALFVNTIDLSDDDSNEDHENGPHFSISDIITHSSSSSSSSPSSDSSSNSLSESGEPAALNGEEEASEVNESFYWFYMPPEQGFFYFHLIISVFHLAILSLIICTTIFL